MRADANRLRECLAGVGRAGEQNDRVFQPPLDPANVHIAGEWAVRLRVGKDARHVFPLNVGLVALPSLDGDGIFLPGLAAIERAADKDAVAAGAVGPVRLATEMIEMQRA